MTIEFRQPRPEEEPRLRHIFRQAFDGEGDFTDLFFRTSFSSERCRVAASGEVAAALYWFDCTLRGEKTAYLYAIATEESERGRGIGSALIRDTLGYLDQAGYRAAFLVPAEPALFRYYERLGFRTAGTISRETVTAGTPVPVRELTAAEYAGLRKRYLPENGVEQDACLELLGGYAQFYAAGQVIAAVSERVVWELLGDRTDAPGLLAALGIPAAQVRGPGPGSPFVMARWFGEPGEPLYLGIALD